MQKMQLHTTETAADQPGVRLVSNATEYHNYIKVRV